MSDLESLPELTAATVGKEMIRLPPEQDVPVTPRVRALIDAAPFRRLNGISQLGLVSLVYPGARHTRFEHSLGVYRLAVQFLQHLAVDRRFRELVDVPLAERFLVAALLHDVGHWPYCHPIEDLRLPGAPRHEEFAGVHLLQGELADALHTHWKIEPREILELLTVPRPDRPGKIVQSLLSGPIDVDKMDYLARDSLHAGVPYGRHFDQARLIRALCLNEAGDKLAITEKGKTAAELMVFARYIMFSEVYWHHGVRSATVMFQHAFSRIYDRLDPPQLFLTTEPDFVRSLQAVADPVAAEMLEGLFGLHRRLYKRVAQFSLLDGPELFNRLSHRPHPWLQRAGAELAARLSTRLGTQIEPHEILIDAPPKGLEVQFKVDVHLPKQNLYRPLEALAPVVGALARQQFDHFVKRVRIVAHPRIAAAASACPSLEADLAAALDAIGE